MRQLWCVCYCRMFTACPVISLLLFDTCIAFTKSWVFYRVSPWYLVRSPSLVRNPSVVRVYASIHIFRRLYGGGIYGFLLASLSCMALYLQWGLLFGNRICFRRSIFFPIWVTFFREKARQGLGSFPLCVRAHPSWMNPEYLTACLDWLR